MKYIFLVLILVLELFGDVVKSPIISVNEDKSEVTIEVDKIDVGINGFIVHEIAEGHSNILNNAVVSSYNKETKVATLKLSEFNALSNSALPSGKWQVQVGDMAVLAFGYTRGMLIAPNEDIYYKITKHSKVQWVHPDIFATMLSFNGHPTPLREDFTKMSIASSVGLVYIYLDNVVYTLDSKSFKILATTDAKLEQKNADLPFYTRVPEIDANWWGEGSSELDEYEPHYYKLLAEANPKNKKLYDIVKNSGERLEDALEKFDIKE